MKPYIRRFLSVIPALALTGCLALTSEKPPALTYRVNPLPETRQQQMVGSSMVLAIREPVVPPGFETDRIALYMAGGRRFDYYADARWPTHLEDMLQETILRSAQAAWPDTVVTSAEAHTAATYRLETDVIDFEPVYGDGPDGIPLLRVKIRFTLLSTENEVRADFTLGNETTTSANTLTAVTEGLEALLHGIIIQAFARLEPHLTDTSQ